ncbi:MAG: hypothetical protein HYS40_02115, partial [Gemmatimonadetes bacterium]|nr:hypothetical protein [Gemmatimonadota bacterium]
MAGLFGKAQDAKAQELPVELRALVSQMGQERAAFETLVARGRESAQDINRVAQSTAEVQKTLVELQTRMEALHTRIEAVQRLVPVMATLDEQTQAFTGAQRRIEAQATRTGEDVKR